MRPSGGCSREEKMSNRPRVKYQLVYLSIRRYTCRPRNPLHPWTQEMGIPMRELIEKHAGGVKVSTLHLNPQTLNPKP